MVLSAEPTATVTMDLSTDSALATLDLTQIVFDDTNWDTARTVTLTGVDDNIASGNRSVTVTVSATSSDEDSFDGLASEDVTATLTDDDVAGVTVDLGNGLTTDEAGTRDTFSVVLDSEPTADVTVTLSSDPTVSLDKTVLTFTPTDWDTAQVVGVTGQDDDAAAGSTNFQITLDPSSDSDATYDAVSSTQVSGTRADNDVAGFTVDLEGSTVLLEGGNGATLTVTLDSEPTTEVSIAPSSTPSGQVEITPTNLTFDASTWDAPQSFTVRAMDDGERDGGVSVTVTLTPTSLDNAYAALDPHTTVFTMAGGGCGCATGHRAGGWVGMLALLGILIRRQSDGLRGRTSL